jgi:hypothetical protein
MLIHFSCRCALTLLLVASSTHGADLGDRPDVTFTKKFPDGASVELMRSKVFRKEVIEGRDAKGNIHLLTSSYAIDRTLFYSPPNARSNQVIPIWRERASEIGGAAPLDRLRFMDVMQSSSNSLTLLYSNGLLIVETIPIEKIDTTRKEVILPTESKRHELFRESDAWGILVTSGRFLSTNSGITVEFEVRKRGKFKAGILNGRVTVVPENSDVQIPKKVESIDDIRRAEERLGHVRAIEPKRP